MGIFLSCLVSYLTSSFPLPLSHLHPFLISQPPSLLTPQPQSWFVLFFFCFFFCFFFYKFLILHTHTHTHTRWSDGMRCCGSYFSGLLLFCCYQPSCVVSQQSWFCFMNFPISPPPPELIARKSLVSHLLKKQAHGLSEADLDEVAKRTKGGGV